MKNVFVVNIEENECWYGGVVVNCDKMPFDKNTDFSFDVSESNVFDQAASLLLSNRGRVLHYRADKVEIAGGRISVYYSEEPPCLTSSGDTLRDAYIFAYRNYFKKDGELPPEDCFVYPQFNDWMEIGYEQSQEKILKYAEKIVKCGYRHSVLMIDDKWSDYYGNFAFSAARFPNPREMIEKLHSMGFKVLLWETPFISPDTPEFRECREKDFLVKNADGSPAIRKWWNGYSAILDLSHPEAFRWLSDRNDSLLAMGIDGFKFDAGDVDYYKKDDVNYGGFSPEEQNRQYCAFGKRYRYNEFRSMLNECGGGCMWRQCDKTHSFGQEGLTGIVGGALIQNLLGYWYSAPDMVGGGSIGSDKELDEELFVRFAEASALMAMMQWSRLPQNCLSEKNAELCKKYADLHCRFGKYIYSLAEKAAKTGDPILRLAEYEFPGEGFERCIDSFMLGDRYFVCPVIQKGEFTKKIRLPHGKWKYADGKIFEGGAEYVFETPLETLPYFERLN